MVKKIYLMTVFITYWPDENFTIIFTITPVIVYTTPISQKSPLSFTLHRQYGDFKKIYHQEVGKELQVKSFYLFQGNSSKQNTGTFEILTMSVNIWA